MKKSIYGPIGSISEGTLRPIDLVSSFVSVLNDMRLTREQRKIVRRIDDATSCLNNDSDYWNTEESAFDIEELQDILNDHALPYFYFGTSDGDGASFGYWLCDNIQDDFDGLQVDDLSEVPKGYTGEVLHVNDHGNIALYACSRGRIREVWSIV